MNFNSIFDNLLNKKSETPTEEVERLSIEKEASKSEEDKAKSDYEARKKAEALKVEIKSSLTKTKNYRQESARLDSEARRYKKLLIGAVIFCGILLLILMGKC